MSILNSQGNTTCCRLKFIIESSLIFNMIEYLDAFEFVLVSRNNGIIKPLFLCTEANYGRVLRAAATYRANEGVSVK